MAVPLIFSTEHRTNGRWHNHIGEYNKRMTVVNHSIHFKQTKNSQYLLSSSSFLIEFPVDWQANRSHFICRFFERHPAEAVPVAVNVFR